MTAWHDILHKQKPSTEPFDASLVNPASVDLRLGNQLRRVHPVWARLTVPDLQR